MTENWTLGSTTRCLIGTHCIGRRSSRPAREESRLRLLKLRFTFGLSCTGPGIWQEFPNFVDIRARRSNHCTLRIARRITFNTMSQTPRCWKFVVMICVFTVGKVGLPRRSLLSKFLLVDYTCKSYIRASFVRKILLEIPVTRSPMRRYSPYASLTAPLFLQSNGPAHPCFPLRPEASPASKPWPRAA